MKLATTRFKITRCESAMMKPGLDLLANRLASARMGSFPFRHPWHRIDLIRSNVHRDQAFDVDMAERILNVRRKLWDLTATRKVRMDALEIAAAILALRLHQPESKGLAELEGAPALMRKLEMLRRRAKRAAESKAGRKDFTIHAHKWRRFVSWCRYNLLQTRAAQPVLNPRGLHPFHKTHWAHQRAALAKMIASALDQKHYASISSVQMDRVVRLLKEEYRRGRHPVTLKELLAKPDDTKLDMLFWQVFRKMVLTPLQGAQVPLCVVSSARTERFAEARHRQKDTAAQVQSVVPSDLDSVGAPATAIDGLLGPLRQLSNQKLVEAVVVWLETYVDRKYWEQIGNFAYNETMTNPPNNVTVPSAQTLGELMVKARPRELSSANLTYSAIITYSGEWLLTWLYRFRNENLTVANILAAGCSTAIRQNPIPQVA